jgi:hypothetical protein
MGLMDRHHDDTDGGYKTSEMQLKKTTIDELSYGDNMELFCSVWKIVRKGTPFPSDVADSWLIILSCW